MDTDENKKTRWEGKRSLSLLSLVCLVCAALSLGNLIARQSGNHPRGGPLPAIEPQVSAVAATPSFGLRAAWPSHLLSRSDLGTTSRERQHALSTPKQPLHTHSALIKRS